MQEDFEKKNLRIDFFLLIFKASRCKITKLNNSKLKRMQKGVVKYRNRFFYQFCGMFLTRIICGTSYIFFGK